MCQIQRIGIGNWNFSSCRDKSKRKRHLVLSQMNYRKEMERRSFAESLRGLDLSHIGPLGRMPLPLCLFRLESARWHECEKEKVGSIREPKSLQTYLIARWRVDSSIAEPAIFPIFQHLLAKKPRLSSHRYHVCILSCCWQVLDQRYMHFYMLSYGSRNVDGSGSSPIFLACEPACSALF